MKRYVLIIQENPQATRTLVDIFKRRGDLVRTAKSLEALGIAVSCEKPDLIVIDAAIRDKDLEKAWKYFPRMMHEDSVILRQGSHEKGTLLETLKLADVRQRIDLQSSAVVKAA